MLISKRINKWLSCAASRREHYIFVFALSGVLCIRRTSCRCDAILNEVFWMFSCSITLHLFYTQKHIKSIFQSMYLEQMFQFQGILIWSTAEVSFVQRGSSSFLILVKLPGLQLNAPNCCTSSSVNWYLAAEEKSVDDYKHPKASKHVHYEKDDCIFC